MTRYRIVLEELEQRMSGGGLDGLEWWVEISADSMEDAERIAREEVHPRLGSHRVEVAPDKSRDKSPAPETEQT
jgi:hypothetical protein